MHFYFSKVKTVSSLFPNCTNQSQRARVTWSHTYGSTNTAGGSVTATTKTGVNAGWVSEFSLAIEVSYSHSWLWQHSVSDSVYVKDPKHYVGWIEAGEARHRVKGTWTFLFPKPFDGYHDWTIENFTQSGPTKDGRAIDRVKDHHMSKKEYYNLCIRRK